MPIRPRQPFKRQGHQSGYHSTNAPFITDTRAIQSLFMCLKSSMLMLTVQESNFQRPFLVKPPPLSSLQTPLCPPWETRTWHDEIYQEQDSFQTLGFSTRHKPSGSLRVTGITALFSQAPLSPMLVPKASWASMFHLMITGRYICWNTVLATGGPEGTEVNPSFSEQRGNT